MISIEEKRTLWLKKIDSSRDLFEKDFPENIEKYRKGDAALRLVDKNGAPVKGKKVRIEQTRHDFRYGANIFMLDGFGTPEENALYRDTFYRYFNLATVPFYWDALEPTEGKPRFTADSEKIYRRPAADLCVDYCDEKGIDAKLHCLVYDKFIPDWLPKNDEKAMEKAYEKHIREIAERYSGRLYEFEVINESLCDFGWTAQSVISGKRDVIEWAFALSRKYLPNDTLVINEARTFFERYSPYRHPYFLQIEKALGKGATIDKIGLQYHIFTGNRARTEEQYDDAVRTTAERADPTRNYGMLKAFSEFGLPLEITEVTLPTLGDTPEDEDLQAEIFEKMYTVWFGSPAVETVVYWNTVDGYAYQSDITNENNCRGGLFHKDLSPKKAALVLKKLFNETWHTSLEGMTDDTGAIRFRGFCGDYSATIDGQTYTFGVHNGETNEKTIIV